MPAPDPHKELALLERRKTVADLYLQGQTQWAIARRLGVDQGQVSRDLTAVRKEWLASAVRDFDAAKAQELAKIDLLEQTYWAAWQKSCEERETTTTEKVEAGGEARLKAGIRKEGRDGNPEFLKGVERCVERRCAILGLNAPTKVAPTDPSGEKEYGGGLTNEVRLARILAILDGAADPEPAAGDDAGAAPQP